MLNHALLKLVPFVGHTEVSWCRSIWHGGFIDRCHLRGRDGWGVDGWIVRR